MDVTYILVGFVVGLLVGLTGVGGGSVMTPILIYGYGITPALAVGTDLALSAVTKVGATVAHARRSNVEWKAVSLLALGSLPSAALVILWFSHLIESGKNYQHIITTTLGITLILTALSLLLKRRLVRVAGIATVSGARRNACAMVITGTVVGGLVAITATGAGALGVVALLWLYPLLTMRRVVGTDLAHATLLTMVAGLGHAHLGTVDYALLVQLGIGTVPGIYLGTHLTTIFPERFMQPLLACTLLAAGVRFVY